jgi:hypothetical protein
MPVAMLYLQNRCRAAALFGAVALTSLSSQQPREAKATALHNGHNDRATRLLGLPRLLLAKA